MSSTEASLSSENVSASQKGKKQNKFVSMEKLSLTISKTPKRAKRCRGQLFWHMIIRDSLRLHSKGTETEEWFSLAAGSIRPLAGSQKLSHSSQRSPSDYDSCS